MFNNDPALWRPLFPVPSIDTHKYKRGHAVILGGERMTGAARLASMAAMRAGAGLCTIVAAAEAGVFYRNGAPHILFEPFQGQFSDHFQDSRRNALLLGPGFGADQPKTLREAVLQAVKSGRGVVLDADALTAFSGQAEPLFTVLHDRCILTPHAGEFEKLFDRIEGSPAEQAAAAALKSKAVIVLKGPETVIAHPDGRMARNTHATPYLATAGAGDVLAGIILGLIAQGMPAYEAACAAAWIHGEAGLRFGPGLVAPDLIEQIPGILRELT